MVIYDSVKCIWKHAKDVEEMERRDEEQRQKELEDWYDCIDEWNSFYTPDPFFSNMFS